MTQQYFFSLGASLTADVSEDVYSYIYSLPPGWKVGSQLFQQLSQYKLPRSHNPQLNKMAPPSHPTQAEGNSLAVQDSSQLKYLFYRKLQVTDDCRLIRLSCSSQNINIHVRPGGHVHEKRIWSKYNPVFNTIHKGTLSSKINELCCITP